MAKKKTALKTTHAKATLDTDILLSKIVRVLVIIFALTSFIPVVLGKPYFLEFNWITGLWIIFGGPAAMLTMMLPTFPEKERLAKRKFIFSLWFAFFSVVLFYFVLRYSR